MGRVATRFVSALSEDDRSWLEDTWKHHEAHATRCRAHAILLSARHRAVYELGVIFGVTEATIRDWLDRWESRGRGGLEDEPRDGAPPKFNEQEQKQVIELLEQNPQQSRVVQMEVKARTGKTISRWTLRRMARKAGLRWKRLKRSLRKHRDKERFAMAMEELKELKEMPDVDLVYFDESGFSLSAVVGYAWQRVGQRLEIPISGGTRQSMQVLGFEHSDGRVRSYLHRGTVTGSIVVNAIQDFLKTVRSTTVLILDNASPHTCNLVKQRMEEWAQRGLILYFLPPYSPELNDIEHLWHKLKYQYLPPTAWETIEKLTVALKTSLLKFGGIKLLPSMLAV
jgi:transposase